MSNALPNPGSYPGCRKNGPMVVYETDNGALCVALPVWLNSETPWTGKHTMTLVKQDGTLRTRTIDDLKKIFGWDGLDPFALQAIDEGNAAEFEIVFEHKEIEIKENGQPTGETRMVGSVQWLNPPGAGAHMPEALTDADQKKLLAKFGSKFKAHSGGASPKPAAKSTGAAGPSRTTTAASGPTSTSKSAGPPSRKATGAQARTSTQEEVWQALSNANQGVNPDDLANNTFYPAVDEVALAAGGDLSKLSIQQWGAVADKLGL